MFFFSISIDDDYVPKKGDVVTFKKMLMQAHKMVAVQQYNIMQILHQNSELSRQQVRNGFGVQIWQIIQQIQLGRGETIQKAEDKYIQRKIHQQR